MSFPFSTGQCYLNYFRPRLMPSDALGEILQNCRPGLLCKLETANQMQNFCCNDTLAASFRILQQRGFGTENHTAINPSRRERKTVE
ncbi:hypothetical protein DEO72_LG2g1607 [Vigna unguiculata]|uniref:Uncharacterized protein n=1 Tax=Vigna unguiculata TaxID=3917 RepID=A0A4D6KV38_VIGUN|nr:hypothetical protein DEO72_LG2g1607 [Vigna unguiculata]